MANDNNPKYEFFRTNRIRFSELYQDAINFVKKSNWKKCILSTPDRDSVQKMHFGKLFNGPPSNKAHIREWNKKEFYNFISQHFDVSEHFLCKALKKHTLKVCQVIFLER